MESETTPALLQLLFGMVGGEKHTDPRCDPECAAGEGQQQGQSQEHKRESSRRAAWKRRQGRAVTSK